MAKAGSISLIVPGLFEPFDGIDAQAFPKLPALSCLLGRADHVRIPAHASDESFFYAFLYPDADSIQELPIAALRWLNDFGQLPESPVICADPVYLRPDKSELRLFGIDQVGHDSAHLEELIKTLNHEYASEPFSFVAGKNNHWYLCLEKSINVEITPLSQALGQDVMAILPKGSDAVWLKNLFNEIQMILHSHAHNNNQLGKQYGPNSVWFHGAGKLPEAKRSIVPPLYSNDAFARGVASYAHIESSDCPETAAEVSGERGGAVIILNALQLAASYGDFNRWMQGLLDLEDQWFAPLLKRLKKRQIRQLTLYDKSGYKYTITISNIMKIWRRNTELIAVSRRHSK